MTEHQQQARINAAGNFYRHMVAGRYAAAAEILGELIDDDDLVFAGELLQSVYLAGRGDATVTVRQRAVNVEAGATMIGYQG